MRQVWTEAEYQCTQEFQGGDRCGSWKQHHNYLLHQGASIRDSSSGGRIYRVGPLEEHVEGKNSGTMWVCVYIVTVLTVLFDLGFLLSMLSGIMYILFVTLS